jgi:hypothetical protein
VNGASDRLHLGDRPSLSGNSGHQVKAGADRPVEIDPERTSDRPALERALTSLGGIPKSAGDGSSTGT